MRISDCSSDVCSSDLTTSFTATIFGFSQSVSARMRDVLMAERIKIGLALSGGGSRAIAFHLGCLRALHDRGVLPKVSVLSRSEEHTSELQSLMRISYAVFCLKKQTKLQ